MSLSPEGYDYPIAYCAAGARAAAMTVLALEGKLALDVVEHPWVTGNDIHLVDPAEFDAFGWAAALPGEARW